jgi:hypothetical protein
MRNNLLISACLMMTHPILDAGIATLAYDTVSILCVCGGYTGEERAVDQAKPR